MEKMLDIYIKGKPELQTIGAAIKLVLGERKRQDEKWGADRNLDDMTWLTILTEEVGETAETILKELPSTQAELVQVVAVALAWLECKIRAGEQRNEAVQRYGDNPVSEQPANDDVPFLLEWKCSCGEVYPITFLKCKCGQERPPLPDEMADE